MNIHFKTSNKHVQISKDNNAMFIAVALASLVIVFSLLSAGALLGQSKFQAKVLKAKNSAASQLKSNIDAANTLKTQYDVFESGNPNIIGGAGGSNVTSSGPSDGDNARIVLDALPDKYDFPALTSSLEKIVENELLTNPTIGGTDGSATLTTNTVGTSQQAQAQPMAFSISATTSYSNSLTLIKDLERSIRPIDVTSLTIQGTANAMTINIQANTYYQPGVSLQIGSKELKE